MHSKMTLIQGSSQIASYAYLPVTQVLVIGFIAGSYYTYEGVPENVVVSFMAASSRGKYLNSVIKKKGYVAKRIDEGDLDKLFLNATVVSGSGKSDPSVKAKKPKISSASLTKQYPFLQAVF
jgi:hypothetical protein